MSNVPVQSVKSLGASNVTRIWVNPSANGRSHRYCQGAMQLPYIKGSEPKAYAGCRANAQDSLLDKIKGWFE